jgi:outer membrane cobalamin receptor
MRIVPSLAFLVGCAALAAEDSAGSATLNGLRRDLASLTSATAPALGADHIIISAYRRPSSLERSPFSAVLVRDEDLRARGNATLARDRLALIPGLDLRQNGGSGNTTSLSLRGTNDWDTRILLDGIPVDDPTTTQGQSALGMLPTAGVNRIEVLKGAQSGLYGSRAVGGVIDFQGLRPGATTEGYAQLEGGSNNTYTAAAGAAGPLTQTLGFALAADGLTSEGQSSSYIRPDPNGYFPTPPSPPTVAGWRGYDEEVRRNYRHESTGWVARTARIPDGDPDSHEEDGHRRASAQGRLEWRPSEVSSYHVAASGARSVTEYDGFISNPVTFAFRTDPDDYRSREEAEFARGSAGGQWRVSESVSIGADVAQTATTRQQPHVDSFGQTRDFDGDQTYGAARIDWQAAPVLRLSVGGDSQWSQAHFASGDGSGDLEEMLSYMDGSTFGYFPVYPNDPLGLIRYDGSPEDAAYQATLYYQQAQPSTEQDRLTGAWGEAAISGTDYEVTLTGRNDWHSEAGSNATMRAGAAWFLLAQRLKLHGAVGTGFRAPSLYERYSAYGNDALDPQESVSYEAGATLRPWAWLSWDSTFYRTDYHQLIIYDFNRNRYANIDGNSFVQGWEHSLTLQSVESGWLLRAWYNPQDSERSTNDRGNRQLPYVADKLLGAEARWTIDAWWLNLGLRHVGRRELANFSDTSLATPIGTLYTPNSLKPFTTLSAAAGYQWHWLEAYVRAENLTDADYEEVDNYTSTRPSAWVGAMARF